MYEMSIIENISSLVVNVVNSSSLVVNDATNIASVAQDDDILITMSNVSLEEDIDTSMENTTSSSEPTIAPTEYVDRWSTNLWMLLTPRVTACISLLGIICVALEAFKDLQADKRRSVVRSSRIRSSTTTRRNVSIISRIQLFYQIPLFSYTLALALGTLPVPSGQAWGAIGSTGTCSLQGILLQFGLHGVYGWDIVLSTTYLMMVRYKVANLRLRSFEKYYHMVIWSFAITVSMIPLSKQMYNFNNTICWLESFPDNCEGDECTRGAGAILWQNLASLFSMIHLIYSVTIMIVLWCSIRKLEDTKQRILASQPGSLAGGSIGGSRTVQTGSVAASCATSRRKHSRAVGIQGILYASGMIMTMFPTAFYILLWNAFGFWSTGFSIFATSLVPLVGYVNFCIFMRGRTVDSCHTRYAQLLRRAHSWMFDYELHFECHCLPKHRGRGMGTGRTSMPGIATRAYQQSSVPNQSTTLVGQLGVNRTLNDPEIGDVEEKEEEAAVETVQNGRFSGFTIKVKNKGTRFSQYISELGASAISEEDDEDCTSECGRDMPPPREAVVDKRPPSKPMRILSELLGDGSGSNQQNNKRKGKGKAAPVKPKRVESCALDIPMEYQGTTAAAGQQPKDGMPPAKPQRYETEIEIPDNDHQQGSFGKQERAPTLPKRYETEIDIGIDSPRGASVTNAPLKKTLFSESGFFIRVKRKGNKKCNEPISELGASGISEAEEEEEMEETPVVFPTRETATDKLPPSMPLRIISEVMGNNSGQDDCETFPVQPEHKESYASDINQWADTERAAGRIGSDSFHNISATRKQNQRNSFVRGAPPTMPQRLESELETSDPSNQDNNTLGASGTRPDQGRRRCSDQTESSLGLRDYCFSGAPSPIPETTTRKAPHRVIICAASSAEGVDSFDKSATQGLPSSQRRDLEGESSNHKQKRSSFVRRAPPTMPQRLESELETSDPSNQDHNAFGQAGRRNSSGDEIDSATDLTDSSFSLHDHSFRGTPPMIPETTTHTPPVRTVINGAASSGAGVDSFDNNAVHRLPPTAEGSELQVESSKHKQKHNTFVRRAAPTMPQRLESELEVSDPSNQDTAETNPDQARRRNSSGEIDTAKDMTESSFSLLDHSFSGAPPTIPESETVTAPMRTINDTASAAAPTLPQRLVSEMEYSESGDSSCQLETGLTSAPATKKQQSPFSMAVASARGALAARVKSQRHNREHGAQNEHSSHKKSKDKKRGSSKTTNPFKLWVSEVHDFETWKSEADEVAACAPPSPPSPPPPPPASATVSATDSKDKKKNKNKNPSTDFKVWKSEISEFETWETEVEQIPGKK